MTRLFVLIFVEGYSCPQCGAGIPLFSCQFQGKKGGIVNRERLTACLKPEHRQAGFYLEDDEDFLYLKRTDKVVAVWNATRATKEAVLTETDRQMTEASR
jgi:hypothetical protein